MRLFQFSRPLHHSQSRVFSAYPLGRWRLSVKRFVLELIEDEDG